MPSGLVFHEGNSFSFDCLCNNCSWHSLCLASLFESCFDLVKVISINIDHMEVKCLEFLIDRIWRVNVCNLSIDLKVVIVNDHYQVVQLSVSC